MLVVSFRHLAKGSVRLPAGGAEGQEAQAWAATPLAQRRTQNQPQVSHSWHFFTICFH